MWNKIKEILKNNKIVIVLILVSIFSIYIFGIRPIQIRKQCATYRFQHIDGEWQFSKEEWSRVGGNDEVYKGCLRRNGVSY